MTKTTPRTGVTGTAMITRDVDCHMRRRRGAAALALLAAPFLGDAAEAKSGTYDITSAKAGCVSMDGQSRYNVEFDLTSSRLKLLGDGSRSVDYAIGAVIQLGHTVVVVTLPDAGSDVTGAFFLGATNKAVFYSRGGVLMNEDTCKLLEQEKAPAVDAPKEVVQ